MGLARSEAAGQVWSPSPGPSCNARSLAARNRSQLSVREIADQMSAGFAEAGPAIVPSAFRSREPTRSRTELESERRSRKPESTEGEAIASTVAANPFSVRCCRNAPASSPGRKASTSKICRRSLSSSGSGISSAANCLGDVLDQRREVEQHAKQDFPLQASGGARMTASAGLSTHDRSGAGG